MPKLILVLLFCSGVFISNAQKTYTCEFTDSVITILPDSILKEFSKMPNQQGIELTPDIIEQFFVQLKSQSLSMHQLRTVIATKDRTIVKVDRSSRAGNAIHETFDSLLYKADEIYMDSSSVSGFASQPIQLVRKEFRATGNSRSIMKYKCSEYLSTDSTCYIWVTTDLPDYINPGIRKGTVKGAVLGFQLKAEFYITRCVLSGFGKGL